MECVFCGSDHLNVYNNFEPEELPFTEAEMEVYLQQVWLEVITLDELSVKYHSRISQYLNDALDAGYGQEALRYNPFGPVGALYSDLRQNIYLFSAAKQYTQVRELSDIISDIGENATFSDFKKEAEKVFEKFNKHHLKTEFFTAVGQAQSAADWLDADLTKELFPLLQYKTQQDQRVRPQHSILSNIVLPVDDPFWREYHPKNGFRCRCFTLKKSEGVITNMSEISLPKFKAGSDFPPIFKMNPGRDKLIFDPSTHPYFRVKRGDGDLKKKNYNMPIPDVE